MFKKTFAVIFGALLLATAVSAADIPAYKSTPTLDGVISEGEYGEDSVFVMDKALVDSVGGGYSGEMTDDMKVVYRFAWDDTGIYIAATSSDATPVKAESWDAHGGDIGPAADAFQFAFFADDIGRWVTVGVFDNGEIAPRVHFNSSPSPDCTGIITGKGSYSDGTMTVEYHIPWINLEFGLDEPGESRYTFEEGTKIATMFAYLDRNEDGSEVRYKNVPADIWPNGEENAASFVDAILLKGEMETIAEEPVVEEPVAEELVAEEPVVEEPVVEEPVLEEPTVEESVIKAPQTFDISVLFGALAGLSAILLKKPRKYN
ncbi:MAG: hypothetical protein ACI4XJ_00215 [Eubacteriales bacterium]